MRWDAPGGQRGAYSMVMSRPCAVSAQMTAMSMAIRVNAPERVDRQPGEGSECAAQRDEHTDRSGPDRPLEQRQSGQEGDRATDQVDPAPGRGVELEDVVRGLHVQVVPHQPRQAGHHVKAAEHQHHEGGEAGPADCSPAAFVAELLLCRRSASTVAPRWSWRSILPMSPDSGLRGPALCGDAHMSNFGIYASPERRLVFDLNDFDETTPGPFEWDVKRLAASIVGRRARPTGFPTRPPQDRRRPRAWGYRESMPGLSPTTATSRSGTPTSTWTTSFPDRAPARPDPQNRVQGRARQGTHPRQLQALSELTTAVDGGRGSSASRR